MNAKEYLSQVKYLENEIEDKKEVLEVLCARAESCSAPELSGMPSGSGAGDRLSESVCKIVELEEYLKKRMAELNDMYCKITYQIEQIADRRERAVLYKHYVLQKDWLTIADEMDCSVQRCYQVHGDALKSFTPIFKKQLE